MKKKNSFSWIRLDYFLVLAILTLGPVIGLIFSKTDWLDEYKPKIKTFDFDPSSFISEHKIIFSSTRAEDLETLIKKLDLNIKNIKSLKAIPNFELLSLPKCRLHAVRFGSTR